ncbi:ABC transporter ATP-binding protein [Calothrix sp. 336/3]|uniref:ABC transporter ATP-binding protein n=1 Tax=Calothrix sp. 336/3 TaxID=1337936 RepID=UPI0009E5E409|nr:ABC transporter ATP-binding protein [Calothrix sp. 336/3]
MVQLREQQVSTSRDREDILIDVSQVSKKFCRDLKTSLFYGVRDIITEILAGDRQSQILRNQEFWALNNISFQLKKGEALGLVGANGAGKSTLLRIISGLIKPDTGRVKVRGRVAPLIALGAGFNPTLTGKENIYANMAILGLSTQEIQRKYEAVIDFAEIGSAINAPVQTYSSGMAARLGFACAIHTEPDILLIDEVLAVGDINFRMKCYAQLGKLRENGTAFILVSHNPHVILNICEKSIYLKAGRLIQGGNTEAVMGKYEADFCLGNAEIAPGMTYLPPKKPEASLGVDIRAIYFQDTQGNLLSSPISGEPANLCIECWATKPVKSGNIGVIISTLSGQKERVLYLTSQSDRQDLPIPVGKVLIQMQMPYCGLLPGLYTAKIYIKTGVTSLDVVESFRFAVQAGQVTSQCLFYQPRTWQVQAAFPQGSISNCTPDIPPRFEN